MKKKFTIKNYEYEHDIPGNYREFTKRFKDDLEVIARLARKGYEKELRLYILTNLKETKDPDKVQAKLDEWQPPALSDPRMESLADMFNRLEPDRQVEILSILTERARSNA